MPNKPQDLDKITRHLNERIAYCTLTDCRSSKQNYQDLLKRFEAGEFETDDRDYRRDIKVGDEYGWCIHCSELFDCNNEKEQECFDSGTKCNFKGKEIPQ